MIRLFWHQRYTITQSVTLPLCALALLALSGCAAILPAAVATEPLWGPLVEDLAKGAVEGLTQKPAEPDQPK